MTWIIFDAADTLLQPTPAVANVYQNVAASHGVTVGASFIKERFGPAIRKHFAGEESNEDLDRSRWQELVFDVLSTDKAEIFDELWEHFAEPSSWDIFDDVVSTWSQLSKAGYRIAIASNFDARLLKIVEAKPGLACAEHIFISSQLGYRKPSSKFFAAIQEQLKVPVDKLVMVGDSEVADFQGALKAGWHAFHLVRDQENVDETQISTLLSLPTKLST